jgi:hypothetical protein
MMLSICDFLVSFRLSSGEDLPRSQSIESGVSIISEFNYTTEIILGDSDFIDNSARVFQESFKVSMAKDPGNVAMDHTSRKVPLTAIRSNVIECDLLN